MQEKKLQKNIPAKAPANLKADIMPTEKPALSIENQEKLNAELRKCAWYGRVWDIEKIPQLIKAGADIMSRDGEEKTALHRGAETDEVQSCILIMEEYAKANGNVKELVAAKDMNGQTAAQLAGPSVVGYIMFASFMNDAFGPFMASFRGCLAA